MRSFFPLHIILGVSEQRDLRNKICQTIRDAQEIVSGVIGEGIFFLIYTIKEQRN
jgi:hypothetical protein